MKKESSIGIFSLVIFFLLASAFLVLYQNIRLKEEFLDHRKEYFKKDLQAESIANFIRANPESLQKILKSSNQQSYMPSEYCQHIGYVLGLEEPFQMRCLIEKEEIVLTYSFDLENRKNYKITGELKEEFYKEKLEEIKSDLLSNSLEESPWMDFKYFEILKGDWVFFKEEKRKYFTSLEDYEEYIKVYEKWESQIKVEEDEVENLEEAEENSQLGETTEQELIERPEIKKRDFKRDQLFLGNIILLDSIDLKRVHFISCEFIMEDYQLKVDDSILFLDSLPENLFGSGDWLNYEEGLELENFQQKSILSRPINFEFKSFSKEVY